MGPTPIVPQHIQSPLEAFTLTFPDELDKLVIKHLNERYEMYIRQNPRGSVASHFAGYNPLKKEEVIAFLVLQFIAGANFCNKQHVKDLYNSKSLPHFQASLSRDRLILILKFCPFDDAATRDEHANDRFGHIRELWDKFDRRSRELYDLGINGTIDEMLLKFCGRCKFRQYMPSKPGRYGIKFWILGNSENHYCYNAIPYLGKEGDTPARNLGAGVVKKLTEPIKGSGRNITCDRYFTGVELFEELLEEKLTAVGMVMPHRKQLPIDLLPSHGKRREVGSSIFAYKAKTTMVSWKPSKNKYVLLLSTMHHNNNIENNGKPEIINFYNETKAGIDALDQKGCHYTTYRKTRRWPMAVFYNVMDIAFVLYNALSSSDCPTTENVSSS